MRSDVLAKGLAEMDRAARVPKAFRDRAIRMLAAEHGREVAFCGGHLISSVGDGVDSAPLRHGQALIVYC